ncbi:SUPPRESSOR OF GENE SILENCING 3 [Hibiscus trionum]|uniref:SUPPRESSOR OF GENE SILENCING 3 n=1 Tax=Hibiscus trionum TaxID=183268 RepID=A0A9W7HRQ2_HIBTR|nr:SUPPRESSOR OF GENE SILENCING 3 [Hibiscus trionum]
MGSRRVKLHRELAKLLEGEMCIKGTSIPPWKGLADDARDHEMVWPPMVVIMNTMTSTIQDGKFVGMGNQELLEHFSSYPALKAQHSYGPQGHRGLSVLIFEKSAVGYLEAERLHKNFLEQRLGRSAWNSCTNEVLPGGERQLYGFMALKEDLDVFNQHCQGKSKIKFELKSYQEAVLNEIKKMRENRRALERKRTKALERSVNNLSRNLQQKMEDIRIFEKRVQSLHEENKEEIESQESFYKDQIKILEARVKELDEKLQEFGANAAYRGTCTGHGRPNGKL